ncbi:hypothetical protein BZA70DRAFT_280573 [Myxozyma melibiosi]|uniref:Ubiquitin-like protease family profile domain-containing protein n=1 Tax=Myxozyma melibiosi TaxID=54550 RepID=A0ABR1F3E9_9ASCO
MSNNEKDVYEVVDADSSSQPTEESPSRTTNSVMHSPTQQRPVSRGLVRPPAGASLLRNYSKRPSDATRIAKPQPRHLISPFTPLNTLDRSIGGIVSKAKRATKSVANSTGFHNFDSGRKRKHEEMKPRGGTAATAGAGRQVKKEGPIQLDSEDEEASPPKNKQSREAGEEEEYSVPVRIAYEDRVVNAPKTPTPKKAAATPPSKINKNFRAVEFEIENLVFGLSGKYSNAPDLRFQLMITPKRSESVVHILQAHKEIPDMTFRHDEIDRINYCLDSLDIAIKLCVRKTSTHFETSADTVLFKIRIPETATSMANYAIKNIEDLSEVFKTKDLRPDEMERFRRTPRPSRRRSLVDDREEQSEPTKSPYFAGDGEKTGEQKSPAETKQLKKYGSSTRKLIDDDLSSFVPKGWEKPSTSSTRVTRRSSGALKASTWATTDLANYDLSEDTAMSTRSQPTRKKLVMGEPPLDYRFGNKTTVVSQDDFSRLDDGEFLNDTILDFYLKYTIAELQVHKPDVAKATFVFNSFFYKKLTERVNGGKSGFESVKKWTTKVDIFSMKYVVIPINEKAHWYVAILCNLDKLVDGASKKTEAEEAGSVSEDVRSDSVEVDVVDIDLPTSRSGIKRSLSSTIKKAKVAPSSADDPTIYVLDSLGLRHNTIFRPLRDYLVAEAKDKRGLTIDRDDIKSKHGFAPTQPNYCDCGVYVAHYVEAFLSKPDAFLQLWVDSVNPKKTVESQLLKLFDVNKLNNKREYIQRLILRLRREVTGVGTSPSPEPTEAEKSAAKGEVEEVKEIERSGDAEESKSGKEDSREIEEITQDDKETTTDKGDEESTSGPEVSTDAAHDVEAHDVDEDKLTTERQDTETGTETNVEDTATEDAPNKDRSEDHEAMSIDSETVAEEADKIIEAVENASRMEVDVDVDAAAPLEESLLDSSTTEDGEGR